MSKRIWSARSKKCYDELDPRLQVLCDWLLQNVADITLLVGHRDKEGQDLAYSTGRSKLRWPQSKHNSTPSKAVDLTPSPVNLNARKLREELAFIAGAAVARARSQGLAVRWGGDWDRDGDLDNNTFDDYFHLELED